MVICLLSDASPRAKPYHQNEEALPLVNETD